MHYKIGDKVKIVRFPDPKFVGEIYRVVEEKQSGSAFECRVRSIKYPSWETLVFSNEIELFARQKGTQLMLFDID